MRHRGLFDIFLQRAQLLVPTMDLRSSAACGGGSRKGWRDIEGKKKVTQIILYFSAGMEERKSQAGLY